MDTRSWLVVGLLVGGCGGKVAGTLSAGPGIPVPTAISPANGSSDTPGLLSPQQIGAAPAQVAPPGPAPAVPDPMNQPSDPFNPGGVNGHRPARPVPGLP